MRHMEAQRLKSGESYGGPTKRRPTSIRIRIDTSAYPLEVVYRVCYEFTDRFFLWLSPWPQGLIVEITPKNSGHFSPKLVKGEFGNALIDYSVRWSIAKETKEVRNRLVAAALAEALSQKKQ